MSSQENQTAGSSDMRTTYRSVLSPGEISSENDSDAGEEYTPLWRQKQEKYFRKHNGVGMDVCPSPTLPDVKKEAASKQPVQKARKNNIWGSVLQEEDLTQTLIKSGGVQSKDGIDFDTRNVESYDYTNRYHDNRPDLDEDELAKESASALKTGAFEMSVSSSVTRTRDIIGYEDTLDRKSSDEPRGRKRKAEDDRPKTGGVFNRLGAKKVQTTRLGEIDIPIDSEDNEVVKKIADFLNEPKVELIERVVEHLGKAVAVRILEATKVVEEGGGMYTLDGSRRRTPGGVYIQLIKQQPEFTNEIRKEIFKEEVQESNQERNARRKKIRKLKRQRRKNQKENREQSRSDHSRSRSNSCSRSRSPKCKGGNSEEEEMEESQTSVKMNNDSGKSTGSWNKKHRSRSARQRQHIYNDYDKQDSDGSAGEHSDGVVGSRRQGKVKPLSFEEELAMAKKEILEKAKSTEQESTETEMVEKEPVEEKDEMCELDEEEANVVDVLLDVE